MALISNFYAGWRDLMDNKSDPRTRDWPLMDSPFPTMMISLCYALFVTKIGPKLMENRKPFQLKYVLIVYNFLQVLFSGYLFYEACYAGWLNPFRPYSWRCQPVDTSTTPMALRIASGCWWYFFSKFTEFFDTLFFIMRKRYDQVSTLHVIHHGIMPFSVWWGVKFAPGGHSSFFGFLNTFVHIIMYAYYMLAAMGPRVQKYLWWKKYLTILQMIQFVAVMLHAFQLIFWNDCNYPIAFVYFIGGHAIMFYFLFSNFYKKAYTKQEIAAHKAEAAKQAAHLADQNGNAGTKATSTQIYESVSPIEESYSTTRQRVFIGSSIN